MLLTENCVEARTGVIEMKKTKAAVIQGLIEFMHLGRVENLEPVAVDLLKLSDKYKMEELKIGFLVNNLILFFRICVPNHLARA
jgi:hypothetical protein